MQHPNTLRIRTWVILIFVGLLGFSTTLWVSHEVSISSRERLQQRFTTAAKAHADLIAEAFHRPLEQLTAVRRLFDSVGGVEWSVFEKMVEPVTRQLGVSGVSWAPRIAANERVDFEYNARELWGERFFISENDADGYSFPATQREHYYPVLYTLPLEKRRKALGLDLMFIPSRGSVIEQAVDKGWPVASAAGRSIVDAELFGDTVAVAIPVYRDGLTPLTLAERRVEVRGVLVGTLDITDLFETANVLAQSRGLRASLYDYADQSLPLQRWYPVGSDHTELPPGRALIHEQNLDLANHQWTLRIEAEPAWYMEYVSFAAYYVGAAGSALTLFLLIFLNRLLGRSARVVSLENELLIGQAQEEATRAWADKLSLAVEQNPAAIIITDTEGRIEYANDTFLECSGYSLNEVIGQTPRIIRSGKTSTEVYQVLWAEITAGRIWRGDLQNRRRNGSLYWERALIAPIKDRDGKVTNYLGINEDITELHGALEQLRDSEGRFRSVLSTMAEGLAVLSAEGQYIFSNPVADTMFGWAAGGLAGLGPQDLGLERLRPDGSVCPPEEYPLNITMREGREVRDAILGLPQSNGEIHWIQANTCPLGARASNGQYAVVLTFSDITERRRAEEELKLAFEVINHTSEGVMVTDAEHRIRSINPSLEKLLGVSSVEITGQPPQDYLIGLDGSLFQVVCETLESEGCWQGEIRLKCQEGRLVPSWVAISVVRESNDRVKHYVSIFSDMTERKEAQERIEFLAHHDPLTGLPNRLLLRDRVEQAQAHAARVQSRIALMYLDLDRFKTINDSLGHPVGDVLLKEVVERLKSCVRDSDTISRQGGDEFIILLNDIRDSEAVSRVADKIHQRMAEPIVLENHLLTTSFSIGVALYPDDGGDFDSLLQKADTAMYHAKEAGRNGHRFFTEQMNLQVVEHLTLETRLRKALENKEFVLHYQPQMELNEGTIVGVEALIRWNSPHDGLVSPAKFIPVAENSGLIVPIGSWVLREACRQAKAWQDAGLPPFVVAVNLSAMQFKRPDLIHTVIDALVLSDLDSQWLELELTESILIQDAEVTLDSVRRLKALGVKLSVDDFGTGYSSLAYLKRFAVDKLKIDQSFIRDLVSDPDDAAIVRAIIQMARSLKLKTIAEGVESEELASLLRLFHCDEIQGYWLARPMPADQLEDFVRSRLVAVPGQTE